MDPAKTHRVGLHILAAFDHRRQRHGVVQEHLAGGRLVHVSHAAVTACLVGFNELRSASESEKRRD